MSISRRNFLYTATAATAASFVRLRAQEAAVRDRRMFRHGVASGDPLSDRVILWTRVTAPDTTTPEVSWELATNTGFKRIVSRGMATTGAARDYTVKIDAGLLEPGMTYYYRFQAMDERSLERL